MTASVSITWSGGKSPGEVCNQYAGYTWRVADIVYGFPTTWLCRDQNNAVAGGGVNKATPSCPTDYYVDFVNQICQPLPVIAAAPVTEAFDYAYAGSLWGMAFTFVLGLYLFSLKIGVVLKFIRGY